MQFKKHDITMVPKNGTKKGVKERSTKNIIKIFFNIELAMGRFHGIPHDGGFTVTQFQRGSIF